MKISDLEKRFWNKIKITDNCWEWQGYCDSDGYGRNIGGLYNHLGKSGTHQQAYILSGKQIPQDLILRHTCNNPKCCRPDHLIPGTHKDNAQDCVLSGRSLKGVKNKAHKLSEQQVVEIKNRLKFEKRVGNILAREYGVSRTVIDQIKNNQLWSHIDG